MKILKYIASFLKSGSDYSSKRLIATFLTLAYVVHWYLVTYIKIEIANNSLVENGQDGVKLLILFFGGFITYESYINNKKEEK